ncbi:putative AAA+ superfamily ATPase [Bradyrhizobium elkanii]
MARSDLLLSIVRAGATGDRTALRSSVEAIVAEERGKNHHILADRLQRALNAVTVSPPATQPSASQSGKDTILESTPRRRLEELILPLPVNEQVKQLVEEQHRADLLRAHGMQPRHRVLLSGPPGNGKTSVAEAIAEALAVQFFTVRYDALVGSYLGETNSRLARLFDYARTVPCVLFFDEFDSIGKERGDVHETGEIKRVVSFLLMQIDQLPSYVVTVAATNHAELLGSRGMAAFSTAARAAATLARCSFCISRSPVRGLAGTGWYRSWQTRRQPGTHQLRGGPRILSDRSAPTHSRPRQPRAEGHRERATQSLDRQSRAGRNRCHTTRRNLSFV